MTWSLAAVILVAIWALWDLLRQGIEKRWPDPHCCACNQLELQLDAGIEKPEMRAVV